MEVSVLFRTKSGWWPGPRRHGPLLPHLYTFFIHTLMVEDILHDGVTCTIFSPICYSCNLFYTVVLQYTFSGKSSLLEAKTQDRWFTVSDTSQ